MKRMATWTRRTHTHTHIPRGRTDDWQKLRHRPMSAPPSSTFSSAEIPEGDPPSHFPHARILPWREEAGLKLFPLHPAMLCEGASTGINTLLRKRQRAATHLAHEPKRTVSPLLVFRSQFRLYFITQAQRPNRSRGCLLPRWMGNGESPILWECLAVFCFFPKRNCTTTVTPSLDTNITYRTTMTIAIGIGVGGSTTFDASSFPNTAQCRLGSNACSVLDGASCATALV
ncbi:hypothetical protein LX36DRAFT_149801 [Colletotrichum falcatum]|nr:hypothetical protein LX36DRAFT_149801 [Colletotrichum falcatum]